MNQRWVTVNSAGVMEKGIAQIYKKKYPKMFEIYEEQCSNNEIHTGCLYHYYENNNVLILNFPTKQHWRSPSKLEYITKRLDWFVNNYSRLGITSIAFPPLGCGNGGLDWDTAGPIMYKKLKDSPIDIETYAFFGISKYKLQKAVLLNLKRIIYKTVNDNWLLVLQLVKILEESDYNIEVSRTKRYDYYSF